MATRLFSHIGRTEPDTATLLDRLCVDTALAKRLSEIRYQALAILNRNVAEMVIEWGEDNRIHIKEKLLSSATPHLLATASRQTTSTVKARREFARTMLIAGLYNQHNPEWDMNDAASYQTETDDMLLLLMQRPDPLRK